MEGWTVVDVWLLTLKKYLSMHMFFQHIQSTSISYQWLKWMFTFFFPSPNCFYHFLTPDFYLSQKSLQYFSNCAGYFFFPKENGFDFILFCHSVLLPALKIVLVFEVLMTVFKSLNFLECLKHPRTTEKYIICVFSTFCWVQILPLLKSSFCTC